MVALVDEVPECTLGRVVALLRERFALEVSESTVSRALKRLRAERDGEGDRERERPGERERELQGTQELQCDRDRDQERAGVGVGVDDEDHDDDKDEEKELDARLRAEVGALVAAADASTVNQLVPVHGSPNTTRRTRATTRSTRKG